ncbi:MAG: PadR family transcriptional regulator [Candidatus Latescibacterota bacterium]
MRIKDIETQNLSKDCNEALILGVLLCGRKHGYQLVLEVEDSSRGYFKFNHGTLYPILHKLEKEGLIDGSWIKEGSKRKRKMYALTSKGRKYITGRMVAWRRFFDHLFEIFGEVDK